MPTFLLVRAWQVADDTYLGKIVLRLASDTDARCYGRARRLEPQTRDPQFIIAWHAVHIECIAKYQYPSGRTRATAKMAAVGTYVL